MVFHLSNTNVLIDNGDNLFNFIYFLRRIRCSIKRININNEKLLDGMKEGSYHCKTKKNHNSPTWDSYMHLFTMFATFKCARILKENKYC